MQLSRTGGVVSSTLTVKLHLALFLKASTAIYVNVWFPNVSFTPSDFTAGFIQ